MKELSVYIHIPFCVKKCSYCDFLSFETNSDEKIIDKYIDALIKDIEQSAQLFKSHLVKTIFFGGGTPTLINGLLINKVIESLKRNFIIDDLAEITIESNPETITDEKLYYYLLSGINRISFGVQSFDNRLLKDLSRIHTIEKFYSSYENAKKAGFNNINIDLMYALPQQSLLDFKDTIKAAVDLAPNHISCYSLIIEEGTKMYEDKSIVFPDESIEMEMYYFAKDYLEKNNYLHYEISNYAKKNYESKHNLAYWTDKEYLGLGLGSSSYINKNKRFKRTDCLEKYINNDFSEYELELLSESDRYNEYMILGLRKINGISLRKFEKTFHKSVFDIYEKEINKHIKNNLLEIDGDILRLKKNAIYLSNFVFVDFM